MNKLGKILDRVGAALFGCCGLSIWYLAYAIPHMPHHPSPERGQVVYLDLGGAVHYVTHTYWFLYHATLPLAFFAGLLLIISSAIGRKYRRPRE